MRLMHEDHGAFHLRHPNGMTIRVPKASVSEATHAKIRGLPRMPAVPHLADGGEPLAEALAQRDPLPADAPLVGGDFTPQPGQEVPPDAAPQSGFFPATEIGPGGVPIPGTTYTPPSLPDTGYPEGTTFGPGGVPNIPPGAEMPGATAGAAQATQGAPDLLARPPETPPPPAGQGMGQGPGMPALPTPPNYGGLQKQVDSGLKTGMAGADLQAKAAQQQAAEIVPHIEEALTAAKAMETKRQEETASVQAQMGQLESDVANTKIDPAHFWKDHSKVSAGLGLILSGIGAGLTGGPNLAAQFINRQIDRDIEAQTADLGKKQNLLGMMYRKYGNIQEAASATRAYLMTTLAGQTQLTAARSGNMQAQGIADAAKSQLQLGAYGIMSNLINTKYQNDWQRYQMGWQQRMMGQVMGQGLTQNYLPSRANPPMGSDPSNPMKYAVEAQADAAKRTLIGPGGKPYLAYPDTAEKARPMLMAARNVESILGQMQDLRKKSSGVPGSEGANLYSKYRSALAEQWAMTNGLTQPSEAMNKNLEAVMPSNWDAFVRGKATFEPITRLLHERTNGIYESTGLHPSAMPILQFPTR